MAERKTKLNQRNLGGLLKGEPMQAALKARADRIAAAAGPGFEASVRVGKRRARASVVTATQDARIAEAVDRRLTRALDAGR